MFHHIKETKFIITLYLSDMKETAADDREANSKNKPAIHKLKMSKLVFQQLMKKDLHDMFLDGGVLSGRSFLPKPMFFCPWPSALRSTCVVDILFTTKCLLMFCSQTN